jgi:beta-glucosidase
MVDRASERVEDLLSQLTTDEKAALTAGSDTWHSTGVDRLGIRGFKVTDGPNGARGAYFVGTMSACVPCGTALASTWNVDLVGRVGELLGEEARSKGADILLGPTINIHRSPLAGRNFECYSEDPYLTARIAVAYIEGVQRTGVGTAVKHLAANDSEFERHTISSVVDERTLREISLPPFEAAIGEARSWSVMAAYNRLNGTYCSEHEFLMSCVHDEWNLPGFVISDWWSIKSTDETGRHGCDLEMPGPYTYLGPKLAEAVESGLVPAEALDGKVRRILTTMEALGVLDRPEHVADRSVDQPRHRELIRAAAREAVVLLTNRDVLPLDPSTVKRLAVIGPNADVAVIQGGGSSVVNPHYAVTVLDGLRARLGDDVEIVHERGIDGFRSAPPLDARWTRPDDPSHPHGFTIEYFDDLELGGDPVHVAHSNSSRLNWLGDPWPGVRGDHFSVRVSTTFVAPEDGEFAISLIAGGKGRLFIDDEQVVDLWDAWEGGTAFFGLGSVERRVPLVVRAGQEHRIRVELSCFEGLHAAALLLGCLAPTPDDGIERAARAAAEADAAIVVVGLNQDWETEGEDRATMRLPGRSDELVEAVAAANQNTVVLVNAGSPVEMTWSDRVGALAQMWYLGQESGNAIADLLVGDHSPSGRLPTTFPMDYEDNPAIGDYPGSDGEVHYREGVFVGYRSYDHRDLSPRFCFGHGLTYTTFEYGQPVLDRDEVGPGEVVELSVEVTNSGARAGSEVVQCYVGDPEASVPRPPRELKGFVKVDLEPGERRTVRFPLDDRAFAFWDEASGDWLVEPGTFDVAVGASSRDLRGHVTFTR